MRYGYFAFEHRKTSVNDIELELIGFAEVNSILLRHKTSIDRLHEWALDLLRTGRHEAGLFSFCYGSVDNSDRLESSLAELYLAWDGEEEMTGADLHRAEL